MLNPGRRPVEESTQLVAGQNDPDEVLLLSLLDRWEQERAVGRDPFPESLCPDSATLQERLRQRIEARRRVEALLAVPLRAPAPENLPNVPGYEVLRELGRGGMGVVYLARQLSLNRLVALKMMLHAEHAGSDALARFKAEAEAVAALQHPNIVQVFEVGEWNGKPFCTLELLEGGSLAQKLSDGPLPPRQAALLVETLVRAVHHAHERGLVHRDLKPGNVLLTRDGTPRITDFGLVKRIGDSGQTQTGAILGTPCFMAPEQAGGRTRDIGPPADIYALGAILYDLLTGRPPFQGATPLETLEEVRFRDPIPPSRLQPRCPRDLETICLACLRKDPHRRYASAEELAEDLRRFLAHEPIRARPTGWLEHLTKWAQRRPAVAALSAFSLLVTLIGALLLTQSYRQTLAALDRANKETVRAEAALTEAHAHLYLNSLTLAWREWQDNRVDLATTTLATPPTGVRRWEWSYLDRLCRSARVVPAFEHSNGPLAFSPDGQHLAAAGSDTGRESLIKIWNFRNGTLVQTLPQGTGVQGMAYSPNGTQLAVMTAAGPRLLDVRSGQVVFELLAGPGSNGMGDPGAWSPRLSWSADGRRLAFSHPVEPAAGERVWHAAVRVRDISTGKDLFTLPPAPGWVSALTLSPDGRQLAVTGPLPTWRAQQTLLQGGGVRNRTRHVSEKGPGGTRVWDLEQGRELYSLGQDWPTLQFGSDGASLTAACEYRADRYEGEGGAAVSLLRDPTANGFSSSPWGGAISPNGRLVATDDQGALTAVWDVTGLGEPEIYRGLPELPRHLAFSHDSKRLAAATGAGASASGGIRIWDVDFPQTIRWEPGGILIPGSTLDGRLLLSPDGRHFVALGLLRQYQGGYETLAGADGIENEWEVRTAPDGPPTFRLRHEGKINAVCFDPAGRLIATAGDDQTVRVWDVVAHQEIQCLRGHKNRVTAVRFHPEGSLLSVDESGVLRAWDVAAGKERFTREGCHASQRNILLTSDGRLLASSGRSAGKDHGFALWDVANGELATGLEPARVRGTYEVAAWSRDGELFAAGTTATDRPGDVVLWETRTGKLLFHFRGHTSGITALAFHPQGDRLVSQAGRVLKVWDLTRGREVLTLESPCSSPELSFSDDGHHLRARDLTGASRGLGTIYLWDATPLAP